MKFSGKGTVFTYSVIRIPSNDFQAYAPYAVCIVQLEEGPKVISQMTDCNPEDVYIGMPVVACFKKIMSQGKEGIICYGFKFRPVDEAIKQ